MIEITEGMLNYAHKRINRYMEVSNIGKKYKIAQKDIKKRLSKFDNTTRAIIEDIITDEGINEFSLAEMAYLIGVKDAGSCYNFLKDNFDGKDVNFMDIKGLF